MEELISKDHIKTMRSLSPWEDGDTYVLGPGKLAEYDSRKRQFVIREKRDGDTVVLGQISRAEILGKKK